MKMTIHTDGFNELDRALKKLPDKMQKRVLRTSIAAGARVVVKAAKRNVEVDHGDLKKSIRVRTFKPTENGAEAIATVSGKASWRAHFIEFGTRRHAVGKGSDLDRGKQYGLIVSGTRPKRFMSPAFNSTQDEQLKAIGKALMRGIEREVNRL